ncbi:MAG: ATP-binding protein [Ardenticatenales bacterium]|nr:ATP-binding protein [Ardenticatenales bacterium]
MWFEFNDESEAGLCDLLGCSEVRFDFQWRHQSEFPSVVGCSVSEIDEPGRAASFVNTLRGSPQDGVKFQRQADLVDYIKKQGDDLFRLFAREVPRVELLPEFRQIRHDDNAGYGFDGTNLIAELSEWSSPEFGDQQLRSKFIKIQDFLRQLLHLPDAELSVTTKSQTIMLNSNGLRLPLASFGTGTHELVILLVAILHEEHVVFCMEEPEVHLHPRLQRELISFLVGQTDSTYLVSSHSPTMINADFELPSTLTDAIQVFHVTRQIRGTTCSPVAGDSAVIQAVHDLGVRPSDLLQTNAVIWVEGPSDRVYLQRWIELLDPDLIEGIHYAVMFYGGRMLAHISLARDSINYDDVSDVHTNLIDVLRINQRAVVLMDRDRDSRRIPINESKRRIQRQAAETESVAWVTHGREIENYLSSRVVSAAIKVQCGIEVNLTVNEFGRFGQSIRDALKRCGARDINYENRKVEWSRRFAAEYTRDDIGEVLRKDITPALKAIRTWNDS